MKYKMKHLLYGDETEFDEDSIPEQIAATRSMRRRWEHETSHLEVGESIVTDTHNIMRTE